MYHWQEIYRASVKKNMKQESCKKNVCPKLTGKSKEHWN